jgi:anthranilate synthase component 1
MLLDLGRNDVGRVSGSARSRSPTASSSSTIPTSCTSSRTSRASSIRSTTLIDALAAGFPAGTVSGAPKVRAMQIIDELEKEKRGLYAGCVGYFSATGAMDTCIVLRTAVVKDGQMYVQAGAGIVADSVNASEQAECVNKAKALVHAADEAVKTAARVGRGQ